jgi:hypothetical protein
VGEPQWTDLTRGLVTVPVKLEITLIGMLAPQAILSVFPCRDIVKIGGIPVKVRSGQQTVELALTGKVNIAGSPTEWTLQLKPPPPSFGIRYIEPPPVSVKFVAPAPVQVVLRKGRQILTRHICRGYKPRQAVSAYGTLQLIGPPVPAAVAESLQIKSTVKKQLQGTAFSSARPGQKVSWFMQPNDPATSVRWWQDVAVKGSLVVLPENAAPGVVVGSEIELTVIYEAFYKKVVFYLTVGLVVVLAGSILFWLVRMGLDACSKGD